MANAVRRFSQAMHLRDPRYGVVVELAGPATGLASMGVAWVEVDIGAISPAHWHEKTEEVYAIIEGQGEMYLDGEGFSVTEGDVISIKPGVVHAIKNPGPEPLRLIVATAPGYDEADDHEVGA
ncbi:MAG TPA: cupin domain-containing protein [Pseudolabrys sp.]|nr:cupin domain-containing protein [Pseudolabrys sp.]